MKTDYRKGLLSRYSRTGYPGSSAAKVASKALYVASRTAKMLNVEKKFHDVQLSASDIYSGSPYIQLLNGIAQGDTSQTRDGGQCKLINCLIRFNVLGEVDTGTYRIPKSIRWMIVLDKQADGTAPTLSELLEDPTTSPDCSPMKYANSKRFRVMRAGHILLPPNHVAFNGTSDQTVGKNGRYVEKYINLNKGKNPGLKVRYSGTGANVSDIASNSLYFVSWIQAGLATGQGISLAGQCRFRFVDN